MNINELNDGIGIKVTEQEYHAYNRLYLLLDLHKEDFYRVAKAIGHDAMTGAFGNIRVNFLFEAEERETARLELRKCKARRMEINEEGDRLNNRIEALKARLAQN